MRGLYLLSAHALLFEVSQHPFDLLGIGVKRIANRIRASLNTHRKYSGIGRKSLRRDTLDADGAARI
jgi:hypothetical protein